MEYYDGTKLLSMKDINGLDPELYLCSTNRTAGKTTFYNRMLVNRFRKHKKKFGVLYRFSYELEDVHNKFFSEIKKLFFPHHEMLSKNIGRGCAKELTLNGDVCGYAFALNNADQVKKISHLISIDSMVFDEFQSETNHYCPKEITKFLSIHKSLARGGGKQVKRLPVYMLSNFVTLLNPYYTELGISAKLNSDTQYLRGDGYVVECTVNDSASQALLSSGVSRAFKSNIYISSASEKIYLNDNMVFIGKPTGRGIYIATFKFDGVEYGIRKYDSERIIYCSKSIDKQCKVNISVTSDDHAPNFIMIQKHSLVINYLKDLFQHGCFRFEDLQCKQAVINMLSLH